MLEENEIAQLDYLKANIVKSLDSTNSDRLRYRSKTYSLFIITTVLTVGMTIILGLDLPDFDLGTQIIDVKSITRRTVLIMSSLVTMLNTIEYFFQNRPLWINNNEARNALKALQFDIEFAERNKSTVSMQNVIDWKNRYQHIIDQRNGYWRNQRSKLTKNSGPSS